VIADLAGTRGCTLVRSGLVPGMESWPGGSNQMVAARVAIIVVMNAKRLK
jgi:hypothetical protein